MKRIIFGIVMILGVTLLCGCSGIDTGNSTSEQKTNIAQDSYVQAEMEHYYKYITENNMAVPVFDEYDKIANTFTESNYSEQWGNYVYVDEDLSFKDNKSYTETLETSDYLYWGELNRDKQPDGIGILYECYYYVDYDYSNPDLLIKYIGEFKDGYYSGYGIEFEIPDWDADYYYMELNEENLYLMNQPIYEGYFEEGLRSGSGVEILSTLGTANMDTYEALLDPNAADYSVFIGNYKKGELEGNVIIYYDGALVYEGEFSNGDINGEGKQYFVEPKGVLKYEGEFSNGLYHGKGKLYDENGEVIHKGKFSSGDID